jgi:MFS transporter, SP family, sugar:H+ symporter
MAGGPVSAGSGVGGGSRRNRLAGILMTMFAAFGGILFGYDTGTVGGLLATQDWLQTFGEQDGVDESGNPKFIISTSDSALVVSILSVGTFFGALSGAVCSFISYGPIQALSHLLF